MFALMETVNGRKGQTLLTAGTLDEAMNMATTRLNISFMEKDADGYEAADIFTTQGNLYVIEKV